MEGVHLVVHTLGMLGGSEAAAEGINGVMNQVGYVYTRLNCTPLTEGRRSRKASVSGVQLSRV